MNISDHLRLLVNDCREKAGVELELEVLNEQKEGKDKICHFCGSPNFCNALKCAGCKRIM